MRSLAEQFVLFAIGRHQRKSEHVFVEGAGGFEILGHIGGVMQPVGEGFFCVIFVLSLQSLKPVQADRFYLQFPPRGGPWNRAPASSFSLGIRLPSAPASVDSAIGGMPPLISLILRIAFESVGQTDNHHAVMQQGGVERRLMVVS